MRLELFENDENNEKLQLFEPGVIGHDFLEAFGIEVDLQELSTTRSC